MQKYQNNILDRNGNAVSGTPVTVTLFGGGLAALYSDNGVTPAANPLTSDANGYFEFYVADGRYNIDAPGGGYHDVLIADTLLIVGQASASASAAAASASAAAGSATAAENAKTIAETAAAVAEPAATTATEKAAEASASAIASSASAAIAEGARDGALIQAGVYVDEPTGRAAVADGQAFKVQGSGEVAAFEYRRINSGSSTLIAIYPAAEAVLNPAWAGKRTGWPDPLFREIELTATAYGRVRWFNMANWSSVAKRAGSRYDGRSLKHDAATAGSSGMYVWLDELDAVTGDYVSIGIKIAGNGGRVTVYWRWQTAAGAAVGADVVAYETGLSVPGVLYTGTKSLAVPATAARVLIYLVHGSGTPQDFWVDAFWAVKGSDVAQAPIFTDNIPFLNTRLQKTEAQGAKVDAISAAVDAVSFGGMTIIETVTGISTIAASGTFAGFGETRTPSGAITFNAVRAPGTARTDAITNKWATIYAEIRDASPTGTVLGSGSIAVDPEVTALGELIIPLASPVTLSTTYFVCWYARNADGQPAVLGEARGTAGSRTGSSYYRNTASDAWVAYSGNPPFALELAFLTGNSKVTTYRGAAVETPVRFDSDLIVLPQNVYALVGRETWIYFDNIVRGRAADFLWDADVAGGVSSDFTQLNEGLRIIPTAAGTATATIRAIDARSGREAGRAVTTVNIAAADAGAGVSKSEIHIGDSQTVGYVDSGNPASAEMLKIIKDSSAAEGPSGLNITLLGTKGTPPYSHEAVSGQTVAYFHSNAASPFVFGGVFDFAQYMGTNGYPGVNRVSFMLGTNDVSSASSDASAETLAGIAAARYEQMITSIKAFDPNVEIVICAPPPPSSDQDAAGYAFGAGLNRARVKRNMICWTRIMQRRFEGRTASGIYFLWPGMGLDTKNNMSYAPLAPVNARSSVMVSRQKDLSHMALSGYDQMGDCQWAFRKVRA